MILKGKYWLNLNNSYSNSLTGFSVNVRFTTIRLDGVEEAFTRLHITQESGGVIRATGESEVAVGISVDLGYYVLGTSGSGYYGYSRILDFGETEQEVSSGHDTAFAAFLMPLPDDEFVNEPNLVQVTNKIMDKMVSEAFTKFESCKPTMSSALLNNTSGTTSLSAAISNYDLLFIRANTYSNYTPLCYTIPAKLMCEAVGSSGSFAVQVADNSKYSNFTAKPSGITYSAGNSGKLYQVYGLKIPTEVT